MWRQRQRWGRCGHKSRNTRSHQKLQEARAQSASVALLTLWLQTCGLQNYGMRPFCCFKPSSLWPFAIATLGNTVVPKERPDWRCSNAYNPQLGFLWRALLCSCFAALPVAHPLAYIKIRLNFLAWVTKLSDLETVAINQLSRDVVNKGL